jgi:hypothetical protein
MEFLGNVLIVIVMIAFGIRVAKIQEERKEQEGLLEREEWLKNTPPDEPDQADEWHFPGWQLTENNANTKIWRENYLGFHIALEEDDSEVRAVVLDDAGHVIVQRMTFARPKNSRAAIAQQIQQKVADVADWIV